MNFKRTISSVAAGAGAIVIGLGIQYAAAAWTSAPSTPPSSNVEAPVNVSSSYQAKTGGLALGTTTTQSSLLDVEGVGFLKGLLVSGALQYIDGHQATSKVLTSDSAGNATWQAPAGFSYYIATSTLTVNRTFNTNLGGGNTFSGTFPITEAYCNSGDIAFTGGGMADTATSTSQARRALWYLGPDINNSSGYICASTDPNEAGRLSGCNIVWAMCLGQ